MAGSKKPNLKRKASSGLSNRSKQTKLVLTPTTTEGSSEPELTNTQAVRKTPIRKAVLNYVTPHEDVEHSRSHHQKQSNNRGKKLKALAKPQQIDGIRLRKPPGVHQELAPLSQLGDIYEDMAKRALEAGLGNVLDQLDGRPIKVATLCSGTESPLLALDEIGSGN